MTIAGIEMSSITVEFNGKDFARIYGKKFSQNAKICQIFFIP